MNITVYNLVTKDSSGKKRLIRSLPSILKAEELRDTLPNKDSVQIEFAQIVLTGQI